MPQTETTKQRMVPALAGLFTFLLCAALGWMRPLFHDEASTWYFAGPSLEHLFEMLHQDVHPPAYFLLAWSWFQLAGESSGIPGLRLISAAFMGMAVTVFLGAIKRWFGRSVPTVVVACVALSPFLVFCGYFARYYALVCLLWAGCLWLTAAARQRPRFMLHFLLGLCGAVLFLTNYAAAVIAAIALAPIGYSLLRQQRWKWLSACVAPGIIAVAAWGPFLVDQLRADLPDRIGDGSAASVAHLVKSGGFLVWTLAVSDGMPPWNYLNLFIAALVIAMACAGVFMGMASRTADVRTLMLISVLAIAAGTLAGWLLLPGPMYSFLPPRVALVGFAWLTLVAVIPGYVGKDVMSGRKALRASAQAIPVAVLLVHGWALMQLFTPKQTTNWAYQVPAKDIAATVATLTGNDRGPVPVYLPLKSFGNIRFEIERLRPNAEVMLPDMHRQLETSTVLIIQDPRLPSWPPAIATNTPFSPPSSGTWRLQQTIMFLREDDSAKWLKTRLTGREITPYKIQMNEWRRSN